MPGISQCAHLRQTPVKPRLEALKKWLSAIHKENGGPVRPRNPTGEAVVHALNQWDAPCAYITGGTPAVDNNPAVNTLRQITIGRRNRRFVGSDDGGGAGQDRGVGGCPAMGEKPGQLAVKAPVRRTGANHHRFILSSTVYENPTNKLPPVHPHLAGHLPGRSCNSSAAMPGNFGGRAVGLVLFFAFGGTGRYKFAASPAGFQPVLWKEIHTHAIWRSD